MFLFHFLLQLFNPQSQKPWGFEPFEGAFLRDSSFLPRVNGGRKEKMRSTLLFNSTVSMFFGVSQQIQESKRRNSQQVFATLCVVNAKIIGIFCNNNCC